MPKVNDKRLIEEYLPLEQLNAIAAVEKLQCRHYVSMVHYWPARRPTSTCRAAIYASLVPAPKSRSKVKEAADFLVKVAAYEPDPHTIAQAKKNIRKAHQQSAPSVLDMFAGGGTIPLEAARLGCDSYAMDYNPVAHLVELCTIRYPQEFGESLANEVRKWGNKLISRIGDDLQELYPPVVASPADLLPSTVTQNDHSRRKRPLPNQEFSTVAYIYARTVPCARPGCTASVPLVRQAWLRKRQGQDGIVSIPIATDSGQLAWDIRYVEPDAKSGQHQRQTGAGQSICPACKTPAHVSHVKSMAVTGGLGESLAAVVVNGPKGKLFAPPHLEAIMPDRLLHSKKQSLEAELGFGVPDEPLHGKLRDQLPNYGFTNHHQLYSTRQQFALLTLVKHIRQISDELGHEGIPKDRAAAIVTYLAMAFGRTVVSSNRFCRWEPRGMVTMGAIGDRQALKMIYDYSEINCLAKTQGCLPYAIEREAYCIERLASISRSCHVTRGSAEKLPYPDESFDAVITDPPYYDSICYADLSSFFYVWLRHIVGDLYPTHFAMPSPPKRREAIVQRSEHGGDAEKASKHYQSLMRSAFKEARRVLKPGAPLVCVYAHRTAEGWATLIQALVEAKLMVTEAWPLQTESSGRVNTRNAAALSSSIFIVARRRDVSQTGQYEDDVLPALTNIATERVQTLWDGGRGLSGANLLMAAVGAGCRAYTKFDKVERANGNIVSAEQFLQEVERTVLRVILEHIFDVPDTFVASVDSVTRFYILWRFTYGYQEVDAGSAIVFCVPQGIELDGPNGLTGPPPSLVVKQGTKYLARSFKERGGHIADGALNAGRSTCTIDVLHAIIWLLEHRPTEVPEFLAEVKPDLDLLRMVAQAICAPALTGSHSEPTSLPKELIAVRRLLSNWNALLKQAPPSHQPVSSTSSGELALDLGSTQK